jgi:hypothetical protein
MPLEEYGSTPVGARTLAKVLCLGGFWAILAASTPAVAGTTFVGMPADSGTGNCFPFGCDFDSFGTGQYQQIYTSSLFTGQLRLPAWNSLTRKIPAVPLPQ